MNFRKTTIEDLQHILPIEQMYKDFVGQWSFDQHESALTNQDIAHVVFCNETQDFLGFAIIKGLTNTSNSLELMRIAIAEPNKGYGKDAIKLLLEWCFTKLHAHRVWLDVRAHNVRAQKVYADIGFTKEGLLRDCVLVNGAYESLFIMSILQNEYQASI